MKTLAFEAATEHTTNTQYNNQTAIIIKIRLFTKPRGGGGGVVVVVVVVVVVAVVVVVFVVVVVVWSTRGLHEVYPPPPTPPTPRTPPKPLTPTCFGGE